MFSSTGTAFAPAWVFFPQNGRLSGKSKIFVLLARAGMSRIFYNILTGISSRILAPRPSRRKKLFAALLFFLKSAEKAAGFLPPPLFFSFCSGPTAPRSPP